jgi:hypothetical protein
MVGFLFRIPVYLLPFVLGFVEMHLDFLGGKVEESETLLGPCIASAAIALYLPMFEPHKYKSSTDWRKPIDLGTIAVGITLLLLAMAMWVMLVSANMGGWVPPWMPDWNFWSLGNGASIATIGYGISVLISEFKFLLRP